MIKIVRLFVYSGPIWTLLGVALLGSKMEWSAVLCGFGALGLILLVRVPLSPILVPYVAKRLVQISIPGIAVWTFALSVVGEDVSVLLLAAKLVVMTVGPIVVLSRWSIHEVIIFGELIGLESYAHTVPASIQRTVLSGPAWIGEANEISKTLRDSVSLDRTFCGRVSLVLNTLELLLLFAVECILDCRTVKHKVKGLPATLPLEFAPIAWRLAFLFFLGITSLFVSLVLAQ